MINPDECEFVVQTEQAQIIRSVVELLKDLIFEATFLFSPSGIKVSSMDSSKSSLVYLKLDASSFELFRVDREYHVGVSLQLLHKLVKIASSNDTLTFFMRKNATHELGIHVENAETTNRTEFCLKMLDLNATNITLPVLEYDHVVHVNSQIFQRLIRDMQNLAPYVTIETSKNGLVLSCKGDFAEQRTTIGDCAAAPSDSTPSDAAPSDSTPSDSTPSDAASSDAEMPDASPTVSATYSLKYLALFSKSSNLSSSLTLFLRRDHPLVMEFAVGSLGAIKFLLSPIDE